jgi:hypothetical protein
MHALQGLNEVRHQRGECGIESRAARDYYVIKVAPRTL